MQEQELPLLQLFRVATSRYNYEHLPCFQILECAASLKYFYFALLLIRLYNRLIPQAYAAPLWLDYTSAHAPEFLNAQGLHPASDLSTEVDRIGSARLHLFASPSSLSACPSAGGLGGLGSRPFHS